MTTIKDVAFAAGVSVGTVSRVLAGNSTVTTKMRLRVDTAVSELGFRPNFAARALRRQKTDIIGLVVPDITNPFFAQLVKHIEKLTTDLGHSVILANTNDDPVYEAKQVRTLLDRAPLGIILISAPGDPARVFDTNTRLVTLDRKLTGYPCIATDHEFSSNLATKHVLDLGHKHIAYFAGSADTEVAVAREKGFVAAINKWQTNNPSDIQYQILRGSFDFESGETLAQSLLANRDRDRPTAIVAASDQQAIGVMRAAGDAGLRIPDDLAIMGFDDIALASLVKPRLTTIRQSVELLASAAVAAIMDEAELGKSVHFPGQLIIRNSTGTVQT